MKRSFFVIGLACVGGMIVAAACAFPDVTFSAGDASTTPETGMPDTGTPDTGTDAGTDAPAPELDSSVSDAQMAIDAESCLADTCDCDLDTFLDYNKRAICDAGTADAAAYDCDDLVKGRNPGVKEFQPILTPTTDGGQLPAGDWNCDKKLELAFDTKLECKAGLGSCSPSTSTNFPNGNATQGFAGDIKCGEKGAYYQCQVSGLNCNPVLIQAERTQGCK